MNTFLDLVALKALPTRSGSSVTFNPEKKVYLSHGYTSFAGNLYYHVTRFSDRLAVCYDIGEGYAHVFLNGITLFNWDDQKVKVIARRSWGFYDYCFFSEIIAQEQSIKMLHSYLTDQAKMLGIQVSEQQLLAFSRELIEETQCNKLC